MLELDDFPMDIREVVTGPCAEPELAKQAAHLALLKFVPGINGVARGVRSSRVPYRNW
jgi:hypothetical protein